MHETNLIKPIINYLIILIVFGDVYILVNSALYNVVRPYIPSNSRIFSSACFPHSLSIYSLDTCGKCLI